MKQPALVWINISSLSFFSSPFNFKIPARPSHHRPSFACRHSSSDSGMEKGESKSSADKECVRVAVNIRPLITIELMQGCTDCISLIPGEPQVQIGSHSFTFDYVFGNGAIPCPKIYDECVASLIDPLVHGYNGTVLAYVQERRFYRLNNFLRH